MHLPASVLITGGCGFIGSHVAEHLATRYPQYRIVVLDKLDSCASEDNLAAVRDRVKIVRGDIGSADLVRHVLRTEEVDTVLHFAAQTHVDNSFGNSLDFTVNNTLGTHVLLEACRAHGGIARFVNVSTDEVYGETSADADRGLTEEAPTLPTNPYSAAKAGAEMLALSYIKSYGMPIIVTRGNNVYGPRQFPEKLVPKLVCLLERGADAIIHGSGRAVRSFLHVDDVARAFDVILHRGQVGETYNIGTDDERTVLRVAEDVMAAMGVGAGAGRLRHVADRPFNDRRYFISSDKLRALGWRPEVAWSDGLARTVAWYRDAANLRRWDPTELSRAMKPHPDRS
eukprot:jgi/Tetstr1/464087/TSEL_008892.t1